MACSSQKSTDRIVQALYATGVELSSLEPQCATECELIDQELQHLSEAIERVRAHDLTCAGQQPRARSF